MDDSIHPLIPGTRVHEFVIRNVLGRGGAGIVYAADHEILRETFAIKEFLPNHLAHRVVGNRVAALPGKADVYDKLRNKFLEEGQTLMQLAHPYSHPNLVQVTDAFRENDTVYLCMRFERGQPLDEILQVRGTLSEPELKTWLMPLLDGLAHAHACGVWHRDIKPSNIFIREDGSPLLIDFGAAHRERPDSAVSVIAQYTPSFAASEQMCGGVQGPWTDIYAMAATCFAVMSGFPPPQHLEPGWQTQYRHYSQSFLLALEAGLQFNPKLRPQSVAEWLQQFNAAPSANAATVVTVAETIHDLPTVFEMANAPASSAAAPAPSSSIATVVEPPFTAGAASSAAPSQSRRKLALIGGSLALGLTALGGFATYQWLKFNALTATAFSLAPEAPAPVSPLPTPAPAIPSLSFTEQLQQQLQQLDCAQITLKQNAEQHIQLTGYLRDQAQLTTLITQLNARYPQLVIETQALTFAAPFCDLITNVKQLNAEATADFTLPTITFNRPERIYHEQDYLVLTVNTGDVGGYLYVDFVDGNQEAVHLFPTVAMPESFVAPNTQLIIGARNKAECRRQPDACFMVSRPHGNNLIIATWSETPLFSRWRTPQAEPMDVYWPVFAAAMRNHQAPHRVNQYFFTTAP
ncbi:serine/threonine protein kinase [Chromatium okenii]|jgi:serine/threonine protein kinase|uniref:Protein kinase domain-containing protein n=1 Tax=Chromatium okenii TaxID=61644 RepID=A0A2S7XQV4_9GAMM|nr:serine/threonine protein kinase [Chromatium okenii]MBV5310416.1 protein kinase [Chromatium okenii]PQJ95848.1 hypothetical protein CXB77_11730 [Chromatium okenii]